MKFLIALSIILSIFSYAYGALVVSWDANNPEPEGYRLFQREENQDYDYSLPVWDGPDTSAEIDCPPFGDTYYYVVRAYMGNSESDDSEEVSFTMKTVQSPTITHIGAKQ